MPRFLPGWNTSQRGVLIAFVLVMLMVLSVRLWRNSMYVSDPQPEKPARFDDLADKVDPNVASWQTLAALPQMGEKRAKLIVEYRETYLAAHPGGVTFSKPSDLLNIRGIGKTTMENLEPYLTFPTTQPASTRHS